MIGKEALIKLKTSKVAVFGIGGVGTYVVEGLVRSGVERFVLVDDDVICITNFNRQIHATRKTLGMPKVEAMKERILDINPNAQVEAIKRFYLPDIAEELIKDDYSYIVDAVDTVTAKIDLVLQAQSRGIPIISSMGAGNKLDPTKLQISDIYKTHMCPLAKVMRKELRHRGVKSLKVVFSTEMPITHIESISEQESSLNRKKVPGSVSFVPSVAGLIIAGEVIKDLSV